MSSILVTGSRGLIGYAIASRLTQQGESVVGLDLPGAMPIGTEFTVVEGDVNDIHGLYSTLGKYQVSRIIHCGSLSGPMVSRDKPYLLSNVNIGGMINLLEAARVTQIQRFIYCSSIAVYGTTHPGLVKEDTVMRPNNIYGATKAAGDLLLQAYARQHGLDAIALRISAVFGPRRTTDCLIRTLIENALAGRPTELDYGADFRRQFVYIEDVLTALVAALQVEKFPQLAYNISGGIHPTLTEVAKVVQEVVPETEFSLAPGVDPIDDVQGPFDISAAEADLGYRPAYSLRQGIEAYYAWIRAQQPS
ncbi:MAG TPA: NAD(P)-dependent oxidoreductase [Coleofasciculaceae cyanobacterium]|jgi:nucleoside-diphosphate-sugar epimerase